ncbi:hypothetical protein ACFL1Y_01020 [Patescibacteria group bacterium]
MLTRKRFNKILISEGINNESERNNIWDAMPPNQDFSEDDLKVMCKKWQQQQKKGFIFIDPVGAITVAK